MRFVIALCLVAFSLSSIASAQTTPPVTGQLSPSDCQFYQGLIDVLDVAAANQQPVIDAARASWVAKVNEGLAASMALYAAYASGELWLVPTLQAQCVTLGAQEAALYQELMAAKALMMQIQQRRAEHVAAMTAGGC